MGYILYIYFRVVIAVKVLIINVAILTIINKRNIITKLEKVIYWQKLELGYSVIIFVEKINFKK